jgi:hypothetical protein
MKKINKYFEIDYFVKKKSENKNRRGEEMIITIHMAISLFIANLPIY